MDPYIQQWSQSEDAQQYLQQAMQNLGMSQQGGMGGYGVQDPYVRQINGLIKANPGNPDLQEWLMKSLVDYQGAMSQQSQEGDDDEWNKAATLASSDDPELKQIGLLKLKKLEGIDIAGGYGAIPSYEDRFRTEASNLLKAPEDLDRNEYDWNAFLANANDEQIRAYDMAKPTVKDVMRQDDENVDAWANALGGMGAGAAAGAGIGSIVPGLGTGIGAAIGGAGGGIWSIIKTLSQLKNEKEKLRRQAAGYTGYSY